MIRKNLYIVVLLLCSFTNLSAQMNHPNLNKI